MCLRTWKENQQRIKGNENNTHRWIKRYDYIIKNLKEKTTITITEQKFKKKTRTTGSKDIKQKWENDTIH